MDDVVLEGSGLTPLASVWALRRLGCSARLSEAWKPGFLGGVEVGGEQIDSGSVLLEATRHDGPLSTRAFQQIIPDLNLDWQLPAANLFAEHSPDLVQVDVLSFVGGQLYPDFLISDSLDAVSKELRFAKQKSLGSDLHPRHKHTNLLATMSLTEAVSKLYPSPYASWFNKLLDGWFPGVSRRLPASFHRSIWAPLYWPESLNSDHSRNGLKEICYFSLRSSFASAIVSLGKSLQTRPLQAASKVTTPSPRYFLSQRQPSYELQEAELRLRIFRTDFESPPTVIHDLEGSGIFRISINVGSMGFIQVESATKVTRSELMRQLTVILQSLRESRDPRYLRLSVERIPISDKVLTFRIPSLGRPSVLTEHDVRLPVLMPQCSSTSSMNNFEILAEPPFNSINGQILNGLIIAKLIKEELDERP